MDKNYGDVRVENGKIGFVICADPLAKSAFFDEVIASTQGNVIYVDFDLMYSGHVASDILAQHENVEIIIPAQHNVLKIMTKAITHTLQDDSLIIIDSLNGMHRTYKSKDGLAVNATLMMLASFARQSKSSVLISCTAVHDSEYGWSLSPIRRRIVKLGDKASILYVKSAKNGIKIEVLADAFTAPKVDLF